MPSRWRRGAPNRKTTRLGTPFEVLLPLQFNDGRDVPDELLWKTVEELKGRFQGVSLESQVIHGLWGAKASVSKTTTRA